MLPYPISFARSLPLQDAAVFIARFAVFAAVHSLLATTRVKHLMTSSAGSEPRWYRLTYNLISLALFTWVMAAYGSSPVLYFAPGIWSLVMYTAQLAVVVAMAFCLRSTGAADFFGIRQMRSATTGKPSLVTDGCYRHMRHPLYFYSLLFMVLNPVMSTRWLLLTALSLIYFIVGGLIEERRLLKEFGETYRDYQHRVPFILPLPK